VLETAGWLETTDGARQAFAAARERLATHGVELLGRADDPEIEALEGQIAEAMPLTRRINEWEGRWPLNTYAEIDASKLSESSRERLANSRQLTQDDYRDLLARREAARAAFAKVAARYDAAVTLGATGAAPIGLGSTGNAIVNVPASLLGTPALTLPLLSDERLPLGLQLIGGAGADAALFEMAAGLLASAFERTDLIGMPGD
jgi:Asp-tRNA(Asn)/Glu-tRNA(Gln) amidotransferase A subunit family amidase